ncbi:MAG TPA: NAD(P)/FAD-dependent oxidoreductase [Thermoplasmata archaeon]|nr:NAD(P)/FAD-dependent oxidoreductase [Thermoplasmata archaeon]
MEQEIKKEYDVIIIGAGIGGLTCGSYLAKAGKKVLICEQHSKPGGYCTSFKRDGFTFEASIHWLSGLGKGEFIYKILEELEIQDKIEFIRFDPVYRLIGRDFELILSSDLAKFEEDLVNMFPAEREHIHKFISKCVNIAKHPLKMLRYLKKTNEEIIAPLFRDQKLKKILYRLMPPNYSLSNQIGMVSKGDYRYPKKGTSQALSNLLAETYQANGGDLSLNMVVNKILIENGVARGVELANGEQIKASYVISNGDARLTFLKLVGKEWLDEEFVKELKREVCASLFLVSLGVNMDLKEKFGGEMIHYIPDLDELETSDPSKCPIEIIIYSNRDLSLAPPGKSTVAIAAGIPYDYMNNWNTENGERGEAYRKLKEEVADQLIKTAGNVIPRLSEHIACKDIATPLTYERYTLNSKGSMMGWDPTPENMSKMFKTRKQDTPIKNLYQVGHWTFPGGGAPTVMISGKNCAKQILKRSKKEGR